MSFKEEYMGSSASGEEGNFSEELEVLCVSELAERESVGTSGMGYDLPVM